jgi:uncharacterized peroxidase-related enzyme
VARRTDEDVAHVEFVNIQGPRITVAALAGRTRTTTARGGTVPHISVPEELPGIVGLLAFKPETAETISAFTQQLLRGPSSLTPGEREMIAAVVSRRNECQFCARAHTAAAEHVTGDRDLVDAVIRDPASAPVSEKMRALLAVASKVQSSGLDVTDDDIAAVRAAGASDEDLHDTVLVAAAFCMFNRYVDGLAANTPTDPAVYQIIGRNLADNGYRPPARQP